MFGNIHKSRSYPWVVVALLWVVALLNYMDRQMLATMRDAMQVDISELESAVAFGRLMAVFLWIYGLLSPFAGAVADRFSRKWLIVGSLFVWSAVTLLMGWCSTFDQIYWLRALMGVSEALYVPAGLSLIADWHSGKSRSLAVGVHMTGLYAGQAVGGFGATIATAFSWQAAFHWFGVIGVVYALLLAVLLREKRSEGDTLETSARPDAASSTILDVETGPVDLRSRNRRKKAETGKSVQAAQVLSVLKGFGMVFSNAAFWVILFFFAAPSLPGWATKNWLPTLFSGSLGIPMAQAGPLSTITIALSSFIGVMVGGPLSDRWVKRDLKGRIYTSAIGLSLMMPALLLLGLGRGMVAVVGAGLCFGIGYGMFDTNTMPILCQFVPSSQRATAYGLMNMTGVFAGAVVTKVLGRWTDGGALGQGFAILALVVGLALVLQLAILHPKTDDCI